MSSESLDLLKAIDTRVMIVESAKNWIEAVKLAGRMLMNDGVAEKRYIDAMMRVTEELGPHAVIAPVLLFLI